jgi:hypothetical protein
MAVPAHLAADEAFLQHELNALIERERDAPSAFTLTRLEHPTVRDILQCERYSGCLYGKTKLSTVRSTGTVTHDRLTCKQRSCSYCAAYVLRRDIRRTLSVWEGAPIYRAVFLSYQDWRTSKRGERFRRDYAGLYFSARLPDGTVTVLFPGIPGEGDPVEHAGEAIFHTILQTEAKGRRLTLPKRPPRPVRDDTDEGPPDVPDKVSFRIPYSVSETDAQQILPGHTCEVSDLSRVNGYSLAREVVTATLGRNDWQRDETPSPHRFYRLFIIGLTPEEIDTVRTAVQPLHNLYLEEQSERRARKQAVSAYAGEEVRW